MKQIKLVFITTIVFVLGIIFSVVIKLPSALVNQSTATENIGIGTSAPTSDLTVTITNPQNQSQVSGIVQVTADASSSAGIQKVDFQVDGISVASDSAYPYEYFWDTSSLIAGSWHTVAAIAYDFMGQVANSAVNVQIAVSPTPTPTPIPTPSPTPSPTPTPTPAPTIIITNPTNGSLVRRGTTINITATANDSAGISKVEFYVNNNLACTDTTVSYSCSWNVPQKNKATYTLTAKSYNTQGATLSTSINVTSY